MGGLYVGLWHEVKKRWTIPKKRQKKQDQIIWPFSTFMQFYQRYLVTATFVLPHEGKLEVSDSLTFTVQRVNLDTLKLALYYDLATEKDGEARRYHGIIMCDNFPENKGSTGENMIREPLKKRKLSSVSFPRRLVYGKVPHEAARRKEATLA